MLNYIYIGDYYIFPNKLKLTLQPPKTINVTKVSEESKENWDLDSIPLFSPPLSIEAVNSSTPTDNYNIKHSSVNSITELMPPPAETAQPDFSCLLDEEGNRTSGV